MSRRRAGQPLLCVGTPDLARAATCPAAGAGRTDGLAAHPAVAEARPPMDRNGRLVRRQWPGIRQALRLMPGPTLRQRPRPGLLLQLLSGLLLQGLLLQGLLLAALRPAQAAVSVLDDDGRSVTLPAPARRIVSLAPHTTELLFAAGAGAHVVATVRYGDYPDAAKALPQVGDATQLDLERIAALKPDLIVVWMHGNPAHQIDRLRVLKVPIFLSEPRSLAQIGDSLQRLGMLAGERPRAQAAAEAYAAELAALRQRYGSRPPLRVFYQVWHQPLLTVNDQHLISDMIHLCGGVNVFGNQAALVPAVSVEAVLAARPQVLATSTPDGLADDSLAMWRGFQAMAPLLRQAVIVPADFISRQSPRALIGARRLCEGMEQVRSGPAALRP